MDTRRNLMPHQEVALHYALNTQNPALFMEMRLGKSLVVLRYAEQLPDFHMGLIVAPKTVLVSWVNELTLEKKLYHRITKNSTVPIANVLRPVYTKLPIWFLISYERLRANQFMADLPWDLVVLDESTCIKNPLSSISSICTSRFKHVPHRMILSGSPMPEGVLNLFPQFHFLNGEFAGHDNFWKFRNRFCRQSRFNSNRYFQGRGTTAAIKKEMHANSFCLTRKQVDLGSTKIYETRHVELPTDLMKTYKETERTYAMGELETKWMIVLKQWLARLAGGFDAEGKYISEFKVDELSTLLNGELSDQQVVVWFRHLAEMEAVYTKLGNQSYTTLKMNGDTSQNDRSVYLDRFRLGTARVLLVQTKLGKYGIDCSAADTAIYFSNMYSCEARVQSEDRIIHPQKKTPLLYIDLVSKGTIEEDVLKILQRKKIGSKAFMVDLKEEFEARLQKEAQQDEL